jgi:hypothetical protein
VPALAALLVISVPDETVTHGVFSVAVAVHDSVRVCPFIRNIRTLFTRFGTVQCFTNHGAAGTRKESLELRSSQMLLSFF